MVQQTMVQQTMVQQTIVQQSHEPTLSHGRAFNVPLLFLSAFLSTLGLLAAGCATSSSPGGAAKRVKILREQAEACLTRFRKSENNPDGVDLEALECYTDKSRQTTEEFFDPSLCPMCSANYGRGLLMLGKYYWSLREKFRQKLSASPAALGPELEQKIARYDVLVNDYMRLALQQFKEYFRAGASIDYRVFQWSMEASFELKNYREALHYLDRWAQSAPLTESDKVQVATWRKNWELLHEKQQLRLYAEEAPER